MPSLGVGIRGVKRIALLGLFLMLACGSARAEEVVEFERGPLNPMITSPFTKPGKAVMARAEP